MSRVWTWLVRHTPAAATGALAALVCLCVQRSLRIIESGQYRPHALEGWRSWLVAGALAVVALKIVAPRLRVDPEALPRPGDYQGVLREPRSRRDMIEVWKHIVQVQMHFNEMVMRVRNFGLTLVVAVVAAAGLALRERTNLRLGERELGLESVLLLAGVVGWLAFYVLDRWYYHMLLVGAVTKASEIERAVRPELPYVDLGERITEYSRIWLRGTDRSAAIRARHKLDVFYFSIAAVLAVWLLIATNAAVQPVPGAPDASPVQADTLQEGGA